jgi:hypothetical protein
MFYHLLTLLLLQASYPDGTTAFVQIPQPRGIVERIGTRVAGSSIIHAAVVIDGYVYEATLPCVQRTSVAVWQQTWLGKHPHHRIFYLIPATPYTQEEVGRMRAYAASQLGRRYMARGFWQHRETSGTFCSKYASEVLETTGRIRSGRYNESPCTLYQKMLPLSKKE